MFSLVIVLVSIALAIALAVAVIYYGGDSSKKAAVRASATTLINQGTQIYAAGTLAVTHGGRWPADAPVFAEPYLSSMPVPPTNAYVAGITPQVSDWEYYLADKSSTHFVLRDKIRREVCLAVNKENGMIGIPASWDGKSMIQCFGPGTSVPGAYTFFYDPPGTTAQQKIDAADQSNSEGNTTTPGYPRSCPDGTSITSGVCADTAPLTPPTAPEAASGFWVIQAIAFGEDSSLNNLGYSESCLDGAVNPDGPGASPLVPHPSEQLKADGVMQIGWTLAPDYAYPYNSGEPLTRTWCVPALESDVSTAPVLASADPGRLEQVALSPAVAGAYPVGQDETWGGSYAAATTIVAKGVAWTMFAGDFDAWIERPANTYADDPGVNGRKVAIGKVSGAEGTWYQLTEDSTTTDGTVYSGESGLITFTPALPVTASLTSVPASAQCGVPFTIQGTGLTGKTTFAVRDQVGNDHYNGTATNVTATSASITVPCYLVTSTSTPRSDLCLAYGGLNTCEPVTFTAEGASVYAASGYACHSPGGCYATSAQDFSLYSVWYDLSAGIEAQLRTGAVTLEIDGVAAATSFTEPDDSYFAALNYDSALGKHKKSVVLDLSPHRYELTSASNNCWYDLGITQSSVCGHAILTYYDYTKSDGSAVALVVKVDGVAVLGTTLTHTTKGPDGDGGAPEGFGYYTYMSVDNGLGIYYAPTTRGVTNYAGNK